MTKCDFCTELTANGKCLQSTWEYSNDKRRTEYCKKAIETMVKAFQGPMGASKSTSDQTGMFD